MLCWTVWKRCVYSEDATKRFPSEQICLPEDISIWQRQKRKEEGNSELYNCPSFSKTCGTTICCHLYRCFPFSDKYGTPFQHFFSNPSQKFFDSYDFIVDFRDKNQSFLYRPHMLVSMWYSIPLFCSKIDQKMPYFRVVTIKNAAKRSPFFIYFPRCLTHVVCTMILTTFQNEQWWGL